VEERTNIGLASKFQPKIRTVRLLLFCFQAMYKWNKWTKFKANGVKGNKEFVDFVALCCAATVRDIDLASRFTAC